MTEPNNYSGVTINITAPTVNAGGCNCQKSQQPYVEIKQQDNNAVYGATMPNTPYYYNNSDSLKTIDNGNGMPVTNNNYMTVTQQNNPQPAYPVQYYTNNYNTAPSPQQQGQDQTITQNYMTEPDMSKSEEIINNLDNRVAEEKNNNKNKTEKEIVALTDEYIKSLENYLNNPNNEIRIMASKEILKRLNEDRSRYDDAALNALLNKMLQDPNKIVRIAAMSALSSELASGNDYTVKLLEKVQKDPNADKEDVLEASNILLKMSATKKTIYVSNQNAQPNEQKVDNDA